MTVDIRELERASIRSWVQQAADDGKLGGSVLDYGCGAQPYRDLIDAVARYVGFDRPWHPGYVQAPSLGPEDPLEIDGMWEAIVFTQVIQYVTQAHSVLFARMLRALVPGGWLVATGPTAWPVVEAADLYRHTPQAIQALLANAGFRDIQVEPRAPFSFGGDDRWCLGWGAVARA